MQESSRTKTNPKKYSSIGSHNPVTHKGKHNNRFHKGQFFNKSSSLKSIRSLVELFGLDTVPSKGSVNN